MLASCAKRDISLMSDKEMDESPYSVLDRCVMENGNVVARIASVEWVSDKDTTTQEVYFIIENNIVKKDVKAIARYIHTRFIDFNIRIETYYLQPVKIK
jgi:hypothetical protein